MSSLTVNAFRAYLASSLQNGGSEATIYIDRITTLTGETIQTSDFSVFGRGTITIDPLSANDIEFASFTAVDATNLALTGAIRGLSAKGNASSTTRMPYHAVSTPVIISFGVHNMEDFKTYIDGLFAGTIGSATDVASGINFMTENGGSRPRAYSSLVYQKASPNMTYNVLPFALSDQGQDITYAGGTTPTMVAPVSNPRIDLIVYNTSTSTLLVRTGTEAASPTKPTPTQFDIVLATVYHRVGETTLLDRDTSPNTQGYISRWYFPSVYNPNIIPAGAGMEWYQYAVPDSTWYFQTGALKNRITDAALFTNLCPSLTFTVTVASPAVFTANAHGYRVRDRIHLTTTGALPTGLATNTDYYIISITTNTFQVALSPGGPAINTTGTQSGTHTVYLSPWGKGDGLTTFAIPDHQGRIGFSIGQGNFALPVDNTLVNTGTDAFTVPDLDFPSQGQAVTLTTTGGLPAGLATSTTYYIIRVDATHVKFATNQANANDVSPTAIDLTTAGTGVHSILWSGTSRTVLGISFGEETHGQAVAEMPSHYHTQVYYSGASFANGPGFNQNANSNYNTGSQGGGGQMNNMIPGMTVQWIIKR